MSPENRQRIQAAVKEAGEHLDGKLPPHPGLQKRNPWAHLWERIQTKMGRSYKACADSEVDEILSIIAYHRANPS